MKRIIDTRGTGKTHKLMFEAKQNGGYIVCANPYAMEQKAYAYGITGIQFISYKDYIFNMCNTDKPIYIDEIEFFLKYLSNNIAGYTLSIED